MGKYGEPWFVHENGLAGYGDNGCNFTICSGNENNPHAADVIAQLPLEHKLLDYGETDEYLAAKEDATRIVLAINACASLSDEALAQDPVAKVREALQKARAALNNFAAIGGLSDAEREEKLGFIDAALALLKE